MERNNLLDPAFVQLAQTNIELREELNSEVEINHNNEKKICQLIRDLEKCEGELIRRSTTILDQEDEIQTLKNQISNLKKQLRSALKEIKANETVIDTKNNQIAGYEDDILRLKARIKELSSHKKISSNQIEMASSPRSPRIQDVRYDSFQNLSRIIRDNISQFQTITLRNTITQALDGINHHYNQSQDEKRNLERQLQGSRNTSHTTIQNHQNTIHRLNDQLTQSMRNVEIAIRDCEGWQNVNANMRESWRICEENYRGEKLMHVFWRVYSEKLNPI
jgi:chromosome segregation ATPase